MNDLAYYQNRVNAALTTNQCLDYAQDVSDLLDEVQRLREGITAGWEYWTVAYDRAAREPGLLPVFQVAEQMWNAIHDAMAPGWRP